MKTLVLASFLGTAAGAFALPTLAGPVHMQVTQPFTFYGQLPATQTTTPGTPLVLNLGAVPRDFVLTDAFIADGTLAKVSITRNGAPVLNFPSGFASVIATSEIHLNSGVLFRAGTQLGLQADPYLFSGTSTIPVTLIGYVQ